MASKYKQTGKWKGTPQYNQSSRYTPPKPKWPKQYHQSATYVAPGGAKSNALPGAKPPTPAAPAAAAPGYAPQALPFDAQYEQQMAGAQRGYENNMAGLQYQEGATRQEYGFDDPSDPFSRARMLERRWQMQNAQQRNTAGARMYSSAYGAQETENRFNQDKEHGALRSDYAAKLNDIQQKRLAAATDRDQGQISAYGERIARAPAAEDPGPLPAAAAAGVKGKAGPKGAGRVLRKGEKPKPVHRGSQGTLTVNKPKKPGVYARVTPSKVKKPKKSKYAGRVM